jgi:hypothetical protein
MKSLVMFVAQYTGRMCGGQFRPNVAVTGDSPKISDFCHIKSVNVPILYHANLSKPRFRRRDQTKKRGLGINKPVSAQHHPIPARLATNSTVATARGLNQQPRKLLSERSRLFSFAARG